MKLPDGSTLMHAGRPYDPVKAHEYYIRTRKLKGRKKGRAQDTATMTPTKAASSYTVKVGNKTQQLSQKQLAEQKKETAQQVAKIKKRLTVLNRELKKRMAEARAAERKAKKGPTAAEKAEAARDAKKYRDKNEAKIKDRAEKKQASSGGGGDSTSGTTKKDDSVEGLKKTISNVQKSLKTALDKQRALASATKNG